MEGRALTSGMMTVGPLVWTFAGALALEPFWNSQFPVMPQITVGRAAIVAVATLTLREAFRTGRFRVLSIPLIALVASLVGLWSWVIVNSTAWGCYCSGSAYGLSEVVAVTVLAALVAWLVADSASRLLIGAALGGVLAALLAVAGIHDVHTGAPVVGSYGSRLWGANGNPNFLALSVALVIPTLVAFRTGHPRWRAATEYAALGLCTAVLVLTFSRGGILAAGAGVILVLVLQAPNRRRRLMVVAGVGVVGVAGLLLYPQFQRLRLKSDFPQASQLQAVDRSGWDTNEIGLVPVGGSRLVNVSSGALKVVASSAGQGVSHGLGDVPAGQAIHLEFRARSDLTGLAFEYGLNDALSVDRPTIRVAYLSPVWRSYSLDWRPTRRAREARAFFWQFGGATTFDIAGLRGAGIPRDAAGTTLLSTTLLGVTRSQADPAKVAESRYVKSRLSDLREAVDAFETEPIRGIGFDTFPRYTAAHGGYGAQPTHNEYARFVTELGLVGALLFALVIGAIASALRRSSTDWRVAAVGTLAVGAVALLFVNGLEASSDVLPLAVAAGSVCGAAAHHRRAGHRGLR